MKIEIRSLNARNVTIKTKQNFILKQRGIGNENVGSMFGNCRDKHGSGLGWN
ncbi:hypothetical protein IEK_05856 [Bacillus toyonensis]|nr:hypothetical protein IEK_05856 [Bacillus toyonensis]